jgi:hypothetical protein
VTPQDELLLILAETVASLAKQVAELREELEAKGLKDSNPLGPKRRGRPPKSS